MQLQVHPGLVTKAKDAGLDRLDLPSGKMSSLVPHYITTKKLSLLDLCTIGFLMLLQH